MSEWIIALAAAAIGIGLAACGNMDLYAETVYCIYGGSVREH